MFGFQGNATRPATVIPFAASGMFATAQTPLLEKLPKLEMVFMAPGQDRLEDLRYLFGDGCHRTVLFRRLKLGVLGYRAFKRRPFAVEG